MSEGIPFETHLVIFIMIALVVGGIFRTIKQKFEFVYTPMLLIGGIALYYIFHNNNELHKGYDMIVNADKHGILSIFVPILLFEPALNANYHYFVQILS